MEEEKEGNPWIVKNLQDFQNYKCPECEFESEDQSEFIEHASDFHDLEESELIMEISKYRFFNCVECEYKNGSKMEFFKHVINNHEKSESLVNSLIVAKDLPVKETPKGETEAPTNDGNLGKVEDPKVTKDQPSVTENVTKESPGTENVTGNQDNPEREPSASEEMVTTIKRQCTTCQNVYDVQAFIVHFMSYHGLKPCCFGHRQSKAAFRNHLVTCHSVLSTDKPSSLTPTVTPNVTVGVTTSSMSSNVTTSSMTPNVTPVVTTPNVTPSGVTNVTIPTKHIACESCKDFFQTENDLTLHVLTQHRRLIRQQACCVDKLSTESFILHYIQVHSPVPKSQKVEILKEINIFLCSSCDQHFYRREDLKKHEHKCGTKPEAKALQSPKVVTKPGNQCDKINQYKNIFLLEDIEKFKDYDIEFKDFQKCQLCSYNYFNRLDLCRHFIDHHLEDETMNFKCLEKLDSLAKKRHYFWNHCDIEETLTKIQAKLPEFWPTSHDFQKGRNQHDVNSLASFDFRQILKTAKCEFCGLGFENITDWKKAKCDHLVQHFSMKSYCPCILDEKQEHWGFSDHLSTFYLELFEAFHKELGDKWCTKESNKDENNQMQLYQRLVEYVAMADNAFKKSKFEFSCKECCHYFPSKDTMDQHILAIHIQRKKDSDTHVTPVTKQPVFAKKSRPSTESVTPPIVTTQQQYQCTKCGIATESENGLVTHILGFHAKIKSLQPCCIMQQSKEDFMKHIMEHANDLPSPKPVGTNPSVTPSAPHRYACQQCVIIFATEEQLKQHIFATHLQRSVEAHDPNEFDSRSVHAGKVLDPFGQMLEDVITDWCYGGVPYGQTMPRNMSQNVTHPYAMSQNVTPQSVVPQSVPTQSMTAQYAMPQNVTPQFTTPPSVSPQFVTTQSVPSQSVTAQYAMSQNVTPQSVPNQYVMPPNVTPQNVTTQSVPSQSANAQYAMSQSVTPQNVTTQHVTTQSVTPQNTTPESVTPQSVTQATDNSVVQKPDGSIEPTIETMTKDIEKLIKEEIVDDEGGLASNAQSTPNIQLSEPMTIPQEAYVSLPQTQPMPDKENMDPEAGKKRKLEADSAVNKRTKFVSNGKSEKKLNCPHCNLKFMMEKNLKIHMTIQH